MYTTILTLHKRGISQRQIAKITNTHRKTVNKIIDNYQKKNIEEPTPYIRLSTVELWHERITTLLSKKLSNVRIFEQLRQEGFEHSYSSLSRYISQHNIKNNTCIRFHTLPGEEAQVDFGDIGKRYDQNSKLRKAYIFNMRLSYSRLDYYEVVFDQKVATWINCHINAFNFFGGATQVIKLDNLKAGVLDANFYEPVFQKEYQRLAKHYGCFLLPCRPYQPQEKGKVESGIKYVKHNFFAGREFQNYHDMTVKLEAWLAKANARIHGTTKHKIDDLFRQEESDHLIKLPLVSFNMESCSIRTVSRDCHITLDNNYYSVPAKYVGQEVMVSVGSEIVKIYINEELIATHARAKGQGIFTTNTSHYARYKQYCPGFDDYDKHYKEKLANIGRNCTVMLAYIQEVQKRDWHRTAKGIISLRQFYRDDLIDKAVERAMHYGVASYSKIKKILESNSYNLPLDKYEVEVLDANIA